MKTILSFLLCVCFSLVSVRQHPDDNFLDLTKAKKPKNEKLSGSGGLGSGGTGVEHVNIPKVIPVDITLLSLDKPAYQLGDEVIYEVRLTNITKDNLIIPWLSSEVQVPTTQGNVIRGYVETILGLEIRDRESGFISVALQGIHGSQSIQSTTQTLRPGHTVRIRAAGHLTFVSQAVTKRVIAKLPQTFEVKAKFYYTNQPTNTQYERAISSNTLRIELQKRRE